MLIGYARISTLDQNHNLQLDALTQAGCQTIYQETMSGAKRHRPELEKQHLSHYVPVIHSSSGD